MRIDTTEFDKHNPPAKGYGIYGFTGWIGDQATAFVGHGRSPGDTWRKIEFSLATKPDRVELKWFIKH